MNSDKIIFELAVAVFGAFFFLKMGEHSVAEEKFGRRAGNRAAKAGEIVELTESAGEGRLASLVWTGDDEDSLRALKMKIVGDYMSFCASARSYPS